MARNPETRDLSLEGRLRMERGLVHSLKMDKLKRQETTLPGLKPD